MPATRDRRPAVTEPAVPWWRVGMVWLVLGGPAAVVVAGLVTAGIAIHGADPVIREPAGAGSAAPQVSSQWPAVQARNHAATAAAAKP